ncbi:PEP-CTERM/exosortase system-associated acyltransferase [Aquisalimonas sp.]|uniref:PEP-CTERM/exosortase system-associated acyltransferase n=1 Tax=unclassified Aquisalimonas TaxID=2644645 RepID=UPI0025B910F6|nr:PEP-CTERM/exosortase system-associated acyltransferase [Aquisalimonas sp.]
MNENDLAQRFNRFFRIIPVQSEAVLHRIFRLRYLVYCREYGFEREEDCPGGMERDEYDDRALHAAVIHRHTGAIAGCVRLITPPSTATEPLPMERYCGHSLEHAAIHPDRFGSETICETSRLAVRAVFRRRPGETQSPAGLGPESGHAREESRNYPLISVALFLSAVALSAVSDRPHMFAMMEPRLARLLARSGLYFTRIGAMIDYHGQRAAFYMHHETAMKGMKPEFHALYDSALAQLQGGDEGTTPPPSRRTRV